MGFAALLALPLAIVALTIAGVLGALLARLPPADLWTALTAAETLFALRLSALTSVAALGIALVLGLPAAYLMAHWRFPGKMLLDTLLDVPLVMPPLVAGLGLLFLLGRNGPVPALGMELLFSPAGVVLALAFVSTAVVVRTATAAFRSVAPGYAVAAQSLGATPWTVFWRVELPLAARGVAAGAVLAWARALGEFGATLMVAGATRLKTETLPIAVFLNIATGETGIAVACALLLLATALLMLVAMRLLGAQRNDRVSRGSAAGCGPA
ncbi:molybdate transport system permease protein [Azospirillum brasilense]|uniref:Molybdate transport system permease protein n=1 Tax=Azospirillum brasilense TaxID=192 RepID=A0A560C6F8_AZOBR|nr:ABC transporter permease [Azospirillum brasilense]TWA80430.1 molybdate transport system permease protein [Azospirillum brasilense]